MLGPMEVLEPLGVTRDLLAQGVKVPVFRIRDRDRLCFSLSIFRTFRASTGLR